MFELLIRFSALMHRQPRMDSHYRILAQPDWRQITNATFFGSELYNDLLTGWILVRLPTAKSSHRPTPDADRALRSCKYSGRALAYR